MFKYCTNIIQILRKYCTNIAQILRKYCANNIGAPWNNIELICHYLSKSLQDNGFPNFLVTYWHVRSLEGPSPLKMDRIQRIPNITSSMAKWNIICKMYCNIIIYIIENIYSNKISINRPVLLFCMTWKKTTNFMFYL